MIPVYPLTEDLQAGDVFLVQTPVQRQEEVYKESGFLPLDQMVTRLHSLDFAFWYHKRPLWDIGVIVLLLGGLGTSLLGLYFGLRRLKHDLNSVVRKLKGIPALEEPAHARS